MALLVGSESWYFWSWLAVTFLAVVNKWRKTPRNLGKHCYEIYVFFQQVGSQHKLQLCTFCNQYTAYSSHKSYWQLIPLMGATKLRCSS